MLKKAYEELIPKSIINRAKQPYRAPISSAFFNDTTPPDYVETLLSENNIRKCDYFSHQRVAKLVSKCQKHPTGLLSERENMAIVGVLSTQLLHHQYIDNFQPKYLKSQLLDKVVRKDENI